MLDQNSELTSTVTDQDYLKGYQAYWDGKNIAEVPPVQSAGWWAAYREVELGVDPD